LFSCRAYIAEKYDQILKKFFVEATTLGKLLAVILRSSAAAGKVNRGPGGKY